MGKAHSPGGPAEADHRLWEPHRDSPAPPQGTTNRCPATEVDYAQQPSSPPGGGPAVDMGWRCRASGGGFATMLVVNESSKTYPYPRGRAGPEIVDFGGLNGPLLPQNPLEKVGRFAPHLFQLVLR